MGTDDGLCIGTGVGTSDGSMICVCVGKGLLVGKVACCNEDLMMMWL